MKVMILSKVSLDWSAYMKVLNAVLFPISRFIFSLFLGLCNCYIVFLSIKIKKYYSWQDDKQYINNSSFYHFLWLS